MPRKKKEVIEVQTNGRVKKLENDAVQISKRGLLTTPLQDLTTEEAHFAWSVLDQLTKLVKERQSDMRERLLEDAENYGTTDDKGSFTLDFAYGKVKKEKRVARAKPNEKAVRELLISKSINPERVFVTRTVTEFDPKAFAHLVEEGVITEKEAEAMYEKGKITWALKVVQPTFVKNLFDTARAALKALKG